MVRGKQKSKTVLIQKVRALGEDLVIAFSHADCSAWDNATKACKNLVNSNLSFEFLIHG